MRVVVKIGGSLMANAPSILKSMDGCIKDDENIKVVVIPGGGMFANAIRTASQEHSIGDHAAHWMAILAMEQYAYYLMEKTGIRTIDSIDGIPCGISILLPYRLLKKKDELPHSWDVTSDTIAAWFAALMDARFIKVTDVDGVLKEDKVISHISPEELANMGTTCADRYLSEFLGSNRLDCFVVNGNHLERVLDAIRGQDTEGTYIRGNV